MITSIIEFFALGAIGFWILSALISIIFIACIENDTYWFPTITTAAFLAVYWKGFASFNLTWQIIVGGVLSYVVLGVVWSLYRWLQYVRNIAAKFRKQYGTVLTESQLYDLERKVSVSSNKSLITGWIAYWPWSLIWNISGDFFTAIYERLSNVYQNITNNAVKGFTKVELERSSTKGRY